MSGRLLRWVVFIVLLVTVGPGGHGTCAAEALVTPEELKVILESYGITVRSEDGRQVVEATLAQILKLAQERNLALDAVRVSEKVAQSILKASRERFNPTLTNSLNHTRSMGPSLFSSGGDTFLSLTGTDTTNFSAAYSQPTESGLTYGLSYTEKRMRARTGFIREEGGDVYGINRGDWIDASELKGSVNIPIYQDFGSDFQNLSARRNKLGLESSKLTTRGQEQDLLSVTASTYWDLVAAVENVKVQEEAVALSRQLLEDNRQRLRTGVISPFDVQVTETQLAREQELLLNARSEVAKIEDLARAILNLEITGVNLLPSEVPQVRDRAYQYQPLLDKMYRNNTNLRKLESSLKGNALDLEEAQNQDLPNLDLELNYTVTGYSDSVGGGVGSFSQSSTDSYSATLTWKMPLFDVQTPEKINQRQLERSRLELDIATLKSDLNVRLQSTLRQLRLAREEVETARVTRRLAEEQLKNEIVRMQVGESTSFRVAQFQQDASEARVREILARLKYERNHLALLVMTGDIYEAYGLTPTHP